MSGKSKNQRKRVHINKTKNVVPLLTNPTPPDHTSVVEDHPAVVQPIVQPNDVHNPAVVPAVVQPSSSYHVNFYIN